jgi:hypothetical protein
LSVSQAAGEVSELISQAERALASGDAHAPMRCSCASKPSIPSILRSSTRPPCTSCEVATLSRRVSCWNARSSRDICSRCCRKRRCWNRKERYAPLPRCITTLCRRYAPTAFFSILDSKSHIPAHTGTTNTRVIVHVPLVIPPACRFRVGSTTREWRPGAAWVFDDTIEHEAWNDSDLPRAILIFDVWNPYLTAAERDFVRTMVTGIARYYGDPAPFVEQH